MLYVYSDLHADVLKHPITVYYFKEGWVALNFVYDIGSRWRIVETQEEGIKGTYDGIWYKKCTYDVHMHVLQRTLTYFVRGSITVLQTSCLTGLDSTKLVNLYRIQHKIKQLNPNQSNRRSAVQWYFPLQSKLVFFGASYKKGTYVGIRQVHMTYQNYGAKNDFVRDKKFNWKRRWRRRWMQKMRLFRSNLWKQFVETPCRSPEWRGWQKIKLNWQKVGGEIFIIFMKNKGTGLLPNCQCWRVL